MSIRIYCVSEEPGPDGRYEVHRATCYMLPSRSRVLGVHSNCDEAIAEARKKYEDAAGCRVCAWECHRA